MCDKILDQYHVAHGFRIISMISCLCVVIFLAAGTAGPIVAESILSTPSSTFTVTKLADTDDGVCDADCSLREALGATESNGFIVFDSNLAGTIRLKSTLEISRNVTIDGPVAEGITISGNKKVRVFYVNSGVHFTIRNLTIADGFVKGIEGSESHRGGAAEGGGMYNNEGVVTIINSTFRKNIVKGGSGVLAGSGGAGLGGAIASVGTVFLVNSTFSANKAIGGKGALGIRWGRYFNTSIISGGGAGGGAYGGAIAVRGTLSINNCTFVDNSASGGGGGGGHRPSRSGASKGGAIYVPRGVLSPSIKNTLIANSSSGGNCNRVFGSRGYNIDSDGTCGLSAAGDQSNVDPKLALLKNNGGSTLTHALLPGSPAINGGNPAGCTDSKGVAISTDQRGLNRSQGGRCDIGAYEFAQ